MTVEVLVSGTTWVVPTGVTSVQVECVGPGGAGGNGGSAVSTGGGGGGGGAYAKKNSLTVTPGASITYQVGATGDVWFSSSATVLAKAGAAGSGTSGGAGGASASCIGDTTYSGGTGTAGGAATGAGGGGSAGPTGAGKNGGSGGTNTANGGGGGGSNGGSSSNGTGGSTTGNGGNGTGGGGGGAGGGGAAAGDPGTAGGGGGGGALAFNEGGAGGKDTAWDATYGVSGGGGGGGATSGAGSDNGGNGGSASYGGGGGGGGRGQTSGSGGTGGTGGAGLIVLTYTAASPTITVAGAATPTLVSEADKKATITVAGAATPTLVSEADKSATITVAGVGTPTLVSEADKTATITVAGVGTPTLLGFAEFEANLTSAGVATTNFLDATASAPLVTIAGVATTTFISESDAEADTVIPGGSTVTFVSEADKTATITVAGVGTPTFVSEADATATITIAGVGTPTLVSSPDKFATITIAGAATTTLVSEADKSASLALAGIAAPTLVSEADKTANLSSAGVATPTFIGRGEFEADTVIPGGSTVTFISEADKKATLAISGVATTVFIEDQPEVTAAGAATTTFVSDYGTIPLPEIDTTRPPLIAVEIQAAIDALGTVTTLYASDARFTTFITDTPAHQSFDESLMDPGSVAISAFGDGRIGGGTRLSLGEMKLANLDGQYDGWLDYGFDGRDVIIRRGQPGSYPADFTSLFVGTVEALTVSRQNVIIRLRDKQFIFDRPALSSFYAGNNVLPDGVEGNESDIKGQPKPKVYGYVRNISPPLVNTSKLVYQPHDGQLNTITMVYDRGVELTPGVDYATSAQLLAATPAIASFDTCISEGYFRLGSMPTGTVTCDCIQGSNPADRTAGRILVQLAVEAGVLLTQISDADIDQLDSENSSVLGVWVSQAGQTFTQVMDAVAETVGAYYAFDPSGVLRTARLSLPAGTSALEIHEYDVISGPERRPARDGDLPSWSATVRHSKNWTVQTTDLAGSVTALRRAELANEWRAERAEDATIKDQFLLADEHVIDSLFTSASEAAAEASRRLTLHKSRRNFFDVGIPIDLLAEGALKLMDVVTLTNARFGLSAGVQFRVLGIRQELAKSRAILTLWG